MLTACWSVKGGSGTTVVAAALALAIVRAGRRITVADFGGDLPVALGLADPPGPGIRNWLAAGPEVPADGLERIARRDDSGITIVPRGTWVGAGDRGDAPAAARLAAELRALPPAGAVVADCGTLDDDPVTAAFIAAADRSLLVLRPCYLAMRRAESAPRPTAVVLVDEPGHALASADVEDLLGVPVVAVVAWDPSVARAVDTGLLRTGVPRRMQHALRSVAA